MTDSIDSQERLRKNIIEAVIKVAVLGVMAVWTFQLIRPFLVPFVWGMILAVAAEPLVAWFTLKTGGRRTLVAVLFVLSILALLVIPTVLLTLSSIDSMQAFAGQMHNRTLTIPPPPEAVARWPVVGESLHEAWLLASTNIAAALKQYAPQIKSAIEAVLSSVGGGLSGLFKIFISTIIAGAFLAKSEPSAAVARKVFTRFTGTRGSEIADLSVATIRGVMQGVVGVAVIQAVLSVIGMLVAGVPAAGLWAILVLICAVSQLPPILVLGPVAAYMFSIASTTTAVLFLVWAIVVSASDGILKPLLMGRGVAVPMLVILIGSLGGMFLSGILGLFVGAVVLAMMYTLFTAWLDEAIEPGRPIADLQGCDES
jgi:predicted PurR-regulated permease PerM